MSKQEQILAHFIEPIGALTKRQDNFEMFASRLSSSVGDVTPQRLETAVEVVMARWRQKSFPTFAVLKEALQAACSGNATGQAGGSAVSEKDWWQEAVKFSVSRKGCSMAKPYSLEWAAWLDYYTAKGFAKSARQLQSVADQGHWTKDGWVTEKSVGTPTTWPWEYDKSYPSRMVEPRQRERVVQSPEERERMREKLAALAGRMKPATRKAAA